MNVLVLSDTHLGSGQAPLLIDKLGSLLDDADAILHAGDVTDRTILGALAAYAPVHAVLGNNDRGLVLPERIQVDLGGCNVAMVHDSGTSAGRAARMRRWFPAADVVVFGHSHLPWHEVDIHPATGHAQHHLNPGSAIQRRAAPNRTAAVLTIEDGHVSDVRHAVLP